jgi:hypothetical protein
MPIHPPLGDISSFQQGGRQKLRCGLPGRHGCAAMSRVGLPMAAWYVQNVSIIFDAPCLFLHHLLSVSYTSWYFYAFSGTNLLTSCHSASSLFSDIFVFQKSYKRNILRIGRNKSRTSRNSPKFPEKRRGDGVGPQGPHTTGRRGPAPGRAPYVWGRLGPLLTLPLRL